MIKSCRKTNRLSAYLDGELDERSAQRMADHLSQCLVCQAEVKRLSSVYDLLGQDHLALQDPFLPTRVASRLSSPRPQPTAIVWIRSIFVPATVIIGLLIGFVIGNGLNASLIDRADQQAQTLTEATVWSESYSLASRYADVLIEVDTEGGEDHD